MDQRRIAPNANHFLILHDAGRFRLRHVIQRNLFILGCPKSTNPPAGEALAFYLSDPGIPGLVIIHAGSLTVIIAEVKLCQLSVQVRPYRIAVIPVVQLCILKVCMGILRSI